MKTPNMKNSIDFYNFSTADNELPILEILNERFVRTFRCSLSNHLRTISTISHSSCRLSFGEWVDEQPLHCCMFILRLHSLEGPVLIKLDNILSYCIIDLLAGGEGAISSFDESKEFTSIELSLLRAVATMIIDDLQEAWSPIDAIRAEYVRTEINPSFVGVVPPQERVWCVQNKIEIKGVKGILEIVYPYSTLFPVRNKLFSGVD